MARRFPGASALLATLLLTTASAANAQTWWTCGLEVPLSRNIGMRMTLVGPALRHEGTDNLFVTVFQTNDPFATAVEQKSSLYEAAFVAFLTKSGYPVTSAIADEDVASVCFPTASAAEAQVKRAEFMATTDSGGGSVRMIMNSTDVAWSPNQAAQSTVQAPASAAAADPPKLGVRLIPVTQDMAQLLGLATTGGAAVVEVVAGSPADRGGLKRTDVLTEVAGQAISSPDDVIQIVARLRPGFSAPIRVWRDGALRDLTVEIASVAPPAPAAPPAKSAAAPAAVAAPVVPATPLKGLDALAPQVRAAVELARKVETQAHAKAAEAEALAAKAREVAIQAQDAAAKAEQRVPGYGKTSGRIPVGGGYSWAYRYAGQLTNGAPTGLGVMTIPETKQVFAGQNVLKRATEGGLGVSDYPGQYRSEGDWSANGLRVRTYANGSRYAGEFIDNKEAGYGVYFGGPNSRAAETTSTVGGYSVMVLKDGRRFEGQGTAQTFEGLVAEFAADGTVLNQGVYAAGLLATPLAGPTP